MLLLNVVLQHLLRGRPRRTFCKMDQQAASDVKMNTSSCLRPKSFENILFAMAKGRGRSGLVTSSASFEVGDFLAAMARLKTLD